MIKKVTAAITAVGGYVPPDKLTNAGGYRYKMARRPELYRDIIGQPHNAEQKVSWLNPGKE